MVAPQEEGVPEEMPQDGESAAPGSGQDSQPAASPTVSDNGAPAGGVNEEDKMQTEDIEMEDMSKNKPESSGNQQDDQEQEDGEDDAGSEHEDWDTDVVCLRMICINNKEQYGTKVVKIKMNVAENANFFCPVTEVPTSINATFEKDTIVLVKIDPFEDWGDFSFEPIFEKAEEKVATPKKNVEFNNNQPIPMPAGGSGAGTGDYANAAAGDDFPPLDNEFAAETGGKACSVCTYNNFASASTCEMCGNRL
jgi:hypothetical protein